LADCDLTTARKGKTMTKHMTGDSGRLGNRQALNRAYQYLNLVPKVRDEEGFKFPMEWVRRHDQYEGGPNASTSCCGSENHHT
jgi:predicted dithiol-disulfide oxidoreductase (DUF899 family)